MTRIRSFLLMTLLATLHYAHADPTHYDVYLLAGQSNMDGRGKAVQLTDEQRRPVEHVSIFYRNPPVTSETWQPLTPGYSVAPGYKGKLPSPTFGPEIGFAEAMTKACPDCRLALIKGSKGGTSLAKDWKPGAKGEPATQGPCYRDFIATVAMALKALTADGSSYRMRGLLWHQGESDAGSTTEVYQERLTNLIARLRDDLGQPDLPIVIGEVFDNGQRDTILAAQRAVAATVPHVGLAAATGLKTSDNGTHFDTASQLTLGERFATAMQALTREPFIAGVDFSHVAFFEARGGAYRDGGDKRDAFQILKDHGVNCVRLRLFTSSAEQAKQNPYNSINNLDYTMPVAVRVKRAGLRFMLDFHYSDTWADPGKQTKPAVWNGLTFDQLEQRMYEYNRDTIAAFQRAGAMPDYVQVGNEITPGMVWPDGRVGGASDTPEQWTKLGRLMKAAVHGIREAAGAEMPKIVVHLDRGGDWKTTQWYFDHLKTQAVPFDIIGESYYPFWHGTLDDLKTCLTNAAARYGKPVLVAETDFPWSGDENRPTAGIKPGKEGQLQFVEALANVVEGIPERRGLGLFWWGTEYLPTPGANLGGYENRGFFDHDGNALPVLAAFGKLAL